MISPELELVMRALPFKEAKREVLRNSGLKRVERLTEAREAAVE